MSSSPDLESKSIPEKNLATTEIRDGSDASSISEESLNTTREYTTKRNLNSRNMHMIAMGGSVGTALFVTIGSGLLNGGPLNLFLAFSLWTSVIYGVTGCCGEFVSYLPVELPFVQMAGRTVDRAFEAVFGLNFYLYMTILPPFEVTAVNGMIHYWRDDYSPAITAIVQIAIYVLLNLLSVRWYGEAEFVLSLGKVILAFGLMAFTFITMVGGNPQHDAYGFRYWNDPGLMNSLYTTGSTGHFHAFLAALIKAGFTIVGPEYVSILANEAGQETRKVMASAFKTVIYRLILFSVVGALCVGIVLPYNDPTLVGLAATGSTSNGAFSPYVIAMNNMGVKILPHIVNTLCISSAFSAGNSYVYCSSRTIYGLARRGLAPKCFKYCTKDGVPIYGVIVCALVALISLLQLNNSTQTVLNWIINIICGAQVLNYTLMCITYIGFYRAVKAQGLDRKAFPYTSYFQPYLSYAMLLLTLAVVFILGYTCFMPGMWSIETFLTNYLMLIIAIVTYPLYKIIYKTKLIKPEEADLYSGLQEILDHEAAYLEEQANKKHTKAGTIMQKINAFLW